MNQETQYDTFAPGEAIARYCVELTGNDFDSPPIVGRDEEIDKVLEILQRRTKNSPVILGEAGVGKTAVVEGLAQRITRGDVPAALKGKRLFSVNLGALSGGARWVGEFQGRMEHLLKDLATLKHPILFIDEMHGLMGLGKGIDQEMDAATLLKPALGRGDFLCIGATTLKNYRAIEADPALENRFQKVIVEEMSLEATVEVMQSLRPHLAKHHQVTITDEALDAAATLSQRYIPQRRLPDKAIDLLDEACARKRTEQEAGPTAIASLQQRLSELLAQRRDLVKDNDPQALEFRRELDAQIFTVELEVSSLETGWEEERKAREAVKRLRDLQGQTRKELERALRRNDRKTAQRIDQTTIPDLARLKEQVGEDERSNLASVGKDEVAQVLAQRTGIPLARMLQSEREKLLGMEAVLGERVIGQRPAIQAVSNAIRRSRAGLSDPNRPVGSFLFLGPTGVGKTELAKAMADFLFDSSQALVRIDMSEFMDKHSVTRLIGVAPGYAGHEQSGMLTEAVLRRPYSIILLDEVEKAHPDVFNILLQVLDDGRLTDSHGRTVDFSNAVIVMTSNLGADRIQQLAGEHYDVVKDAAMHAVAGHFRPEFINRIDAIQVFHPLEKSQAEQIARLELGHVQQRLHAQQVELEVTPSGIALLTDMGYDRAMGARPLKRVLQQTIEDQLAMKLIDGTLGPGSKAVGDAVEGRFVLTVEGAA